MNVVAKKSLGQNFLIDEKILNLIVSLGNINSNDIESKLLIIRRKI